MPPARRASPATLEAAGVATLLPPADYSSVLWSWQLPAGQTYGRLHDALKADGFVIYAGQGDLGAQIFRIAHMGDIRPDDLDRLCGALGRHLGGRPGARAMRSAVILAAGRGTRLAGHVGDFPKGFLRLGELPIIEESIDRLVQAGIRDVLIVTGHCAAHYDDLARRRPGLVRTVHNPRFAESGQHVLPVLRPGRRATARSCCWSPTWCTSPAP